MRDIKIGDCPKNNEQVGGSIAVKPICFGVSRLAQVQALTLTVSSWGSYLTSHSLSFLIYAMEITVPVSCSYGKDDEDDDEL